MDLYFERFVTGAIVVFCIITIVAYIQALIKKNDTAWMILSAILGLTMCYLIGWGIQVLLK